MESSKRRSINQGKDKSEAIEKEKTRKKLNSKQIEILEALYKFRFITSELVVQYQELSSRKYTYRRLANLVEQEYIGRNYNSSYRLQNKYASYYLKPKAIRFLKQQPKSELNLKVLNNAYKDKNASQHFIDHSIEVFELYIKFMELYKYETSTSPAVNKTSKTSQSLLEFYAKTELYEYDFFPRPLPDGYLRFVAKARYKTSTFMLEYIEAATPYFLVRRRIKQYINHIDSGDWTDGDYPLVLIVCETPVLERRITRYIIKSLEDIYVDELSFGLTTKEAFMNSTDKKDKIWLPVSDEIGARTLLGRLTPEVS